MDQNHKKDIIYIRLPYIFVQLPQLLQIFLCMPQLLPNKMIMTMHEKQPPVKDIVKMLAKPPPYALIIYSSIQKNVLLLRKAKLHHYHYITCYYTIS